MATTIARPAAVAAVMEQSSRLVPKVLEASVNQPHGLGCLTVIILGIMAVGNRRGIVFATGRVIVSRNLTGNRVIQMPPIRANRRGQAPSEHGGQRQGERYASPFSESHGQSLAYSSMKPPGMSGIKRASGGCSRLSCARTTPSALAKTRTGSHPGRQCLPCQTRFIPRLEPARIAGAAKASGALPPQRRGCGLRFLDLTLPLTIGPGPHNLDRIPRPASCEKSDPPLHAQGSDHLDRSTVAVPDAQWPLP